jgi:hypothetical protein
MKNIEPIEPTHPEAVPKDVSGAAEEPIHPEVVPEDATGVAEYFGWLVLD